MRFLTTLSLAVLCLMLAVAPASASTLYSNGPINGTIDAYTINFGYQVTDSFTLTSGATVTNVDNIGLWLFPGDKPLTVDWSITSQPFGGTVYGSGTANFSSQFLYTNGYGYDIYSGMITFPGVNLGAGTYYIELQNATTAQSNPLYWDQNNGASLAYDSALGQIPSESFEITGGSNSGVPEPASLFMLGSGLLGLGGLVRKRMKA
ncbi:MAG TPA: PEP-CTERM sorting domain-containing protein [Terriglobales bacterium]|nr:PEP-CTERM sorting domain-containing protein [Terriglobales bacterium]